MPEAPASPPPAPQDSRVLYLRWRPSTFSQVVGQEHAVQTLRNSAASGRMAHAYLFSGPRGTGKTSIARILYKAANCPNADRGEPCDQCPICTSANEGRSLDLIEMDAASNRGIDDIRDLRERVQFSPVSGPYRVYIVDEAHELTRDAWDAFLKTLEEPPPHVIFVLATTEAHRVPATISSRCQRFDFRRLSLVSVRDRLREIALSEGLNVDEDAIDAIGRLANGGMRDAISLLDQVRAYCGVNISMDDARSVLGLPAAGTARGILDAVAQGDLASALATLDDALLLGADTRLLIEQLQEHARALLLAGFRAADTVELELGPEAIEWTRGAVSHWRRERLLSLTRTLADALARIRDSQRLRLEIELILAEASMSQDSTDRPSEPALAARPLSEAADTKLKPPAAAFAGSRPPEAVPLARTIPRPEVTVPRSAPGATDASKPVPTPAAEPPEMSAATPAGTIAPGPIIERDANEMDPMDIAAEQPLTMERVRDSWRSVIGSVGAQNGPLGAVLDAAQPMTVEGQTVVLGVPYAFHVRLIVEQRNRRMIEDTWTRELGNRIRIDCRPAQDEQRAASAPPVIDDPVVRAALEIFGGELAVIEDDEE